MLLKIVKNRYCTLFSVVAQFIGQIISRFLCVVLCTNLLLFTVLCNSFLTAADKKIQTLSNKLTKTVKAQEKIGLINELKEYIPGLAVPAEIKDLSSDQDQFVRQEIMELFTLSKDSACLSYALDRVENDTDLETRLRALVYLETHYDTDIAEKLSLWLNDKKINLYVRMKIVDIFGKWAEMGDSTAKTNLKIVAEDKADNQDLTQLAKLYLENIK